MELQLPADSMNASGVRIKEAVPVWEGQHSCEEVFVSKGEERLIERTQHRAVHRDAVGDVRRRVILKRFAHEGELELRLLHTACVEQDPRPAGVELA